jgi:hypothetical protein
MKKKDSPRKESTPRKQKKFKAQEVEKGLSKVVSQKIKIY